MDLGASAGNLGMSMGIGVLGSISMDPGMGAGVYVLALMDLGTGTKDLGLALISLGLASMGTRILGPALMDQAPVPRAWE